MSETFRNLQGVNKAGQKGAWVRPENPKQTPKKVKDQDTKAQTNK